MSTSLSTPLKDYSFSRLWIGQSLSRLGDSIILVMLPLVVYHILGSTIDMGLVMTLLMVPQVILLPFTGIIADRFSRTKLMVLSDLIRFCLLVVMASCSAFNWVNMFVLYGYAVIAGIMSALFQPAYAAVRAQVFTPTIRNAANSLNQISEQMAMLIGPTIGGLIVSFTSLTVGFGLDALTFLVSIVTLLMLRVNEPLNKNSSTSLKSFARELLGGYRELRKHRWLWITIIAFTFINIAFAGFVPILIPWLIKKHIGLPAYAYGLLISASGMGSLIVALFFGKRQKWNHRGLYAYCGIIFSGMALGGMVFVSWLPGLMLLMGSYGIGITLFDLIWEGSLQEIVPREAYGRVASLDMLGGWALIPIGYFATGVLMKSIGGTDTMLIESLLVIGLTAAMLFIKDIRSFD